MNQRRLQTLLDATTERPWDLEVEQQFDLTQEDRAELTSLLELVRQLGEAIQIIQPEAAFRQNLHLSLLAAASDREVQQAGDWRQLARSWKLAAAAAAAASGVSLGLITVIAVSRYRANAT